MNSLSTTTLFFCTVLSFLLVGAAFCILPMPDSAFKTINQRCVSSECIAHFAEYYQDEKITPYEYHSLKQWFYDAIGTNELKARELLKVTQ